MIYPAKHIPRPEGVCLPGRIVAAPSWVFPGSLAENCRFLAHRVDEAGLLFFESAASLAYDAQDLPADLALLPLRYHMHLPVDLPMHRPKEAAAICHALFEKTAFLGPLKGVLHPPAGVAPGDAPPPRRAFSGKDCAARLAAFLESFAAMGNEPSSLLLENTRENDLLCLEGVIVDYNLQICLDMGHALAYGQHALLERQALLHRAGMIHVNAPGRGKEKGRHLPLTALSSEESALAERMLCAVPKEAVVMLEFFSWPHIEESLPLARRWLGRA